MAEKRFESAPPLSLSGFPARNFHCTIYRPQWMRLRHHKFCAVLIALAIHIGNNLICTSFFRHTTCLMHILLPGINDAHDDRLIKIQSFPPHSACSYEDFSSPLTQGRRMKTPTIPLGRSVLHVALLII